MSTRFVSKTVWDFPFLIVLFLLKFVFVQLNAWTTLKCHNSFSTTIVEKLHSFSPRPLIVNFQQVLKLNGICMSWSSTSFIRPSLIENSFINIHRIWIFVNFWYLVSYIFCFFLFTVLFGWNGHIFLML